MAHPSNGEWLSCVKCGSALYRKKSEINPSGNHYCSQICYKVVRSKDAKSYVKTGARHTHRIVAEKKLGRPLLPGEIVHHVDEDKRNPAEDNLAVLPSQSQHASIHFRGTKQSADHVKKRIDAMRKTLHSQGRTR